MKKTIIWLLILALAAVTAVWLYLFYFGAKHKDPLKAKQIEVHAEDLYRLYSEYEDSANKLYLGKVIRVTGKPQSVELINGRYNIHFESGSEFGHVLCEMDTAENKKISENMSLKSMSVAGFCNGINMDVYLDRCKLAE